ncbi:MAG: aldehyde ferredoxin oxidoreductase family protein [Gammaproteobacteria bacterium]|nr:aldehyde ferredoxin oxidoreductase family protein [Gammaproteobacteria bacterium]
MGWQRKLLRINLTEGSIIHEPLNMEWAGQYLGGRGLATKYLWEGMDPKADALSPGNVLIFTTGPLTGTMASTGGRYAVVTKGPLTNAIACSNSGGKFGAELKLAGYDLLILEGRSPTPVYLLILDDEVKLMPAEHYWGQTVWHTEENLKEVHQDPQIKVASIGVAGEQGVRYACVVNDLHRAAGRSGVGAVMGSKNLKAIAVRGTKGVTVKDPAAFMSAVNETKGMLANNAGRKELTDYGTNAMIDTMQEFGGLPTNNFQQVQFDGTDQINPAAMSATNENGHTNLITNKACFGCTIGCGRIAHIDKNHFSVKDRKEYWHASGGLEYETAFALGPVIGVDDIDALTFAGYMMNEHGIDPISFGVTLAAAMELFELGILTTADTDGIELKFGNAEALTIMAEKTGKHEGFGKILGLGSRRMCEKYGRPELSMSVKGQEFAGYDSRALQGMGLGYATSNRGACHLKHDVFAQDMEDQSGRGKARPCKESQDKIAMIDSTGVCLFTTAAWDTDEFQQQISAACEGDWDSERLLLTGERIWNLERRFNLAAGLTRADDTLPPRLLNDPAPAGVAKGRVAELDVMLPEYYALRGWTDGGEPTAETLNRLGIN